MDGVFINLTNENITIQVSGQSITIPSNEDLVTPIKQIIKTDATLSGIVSTQLADNDIHNLQATKWFNTAYNKIQRSERNIIITVPMISPYVKYPFTKDQIEKINNISNGRPRLLILTKQDAEYWSSGSFENPFRNYRLFSYIDEELIEYPIPKTYLDVMVSSVKNLLQ